MNARLIVGSRFIIHRGIPKWSQRF